MKLHSPEFLASRRRLAAAAGLAFAAPSLFAAEPGWDVIIVGAGGAGLAAALSAAEAGARVLVLEKLSEIGGNTRISGGYFAAVDPERQKPQGIDDSVEHFLQQILESGGGKSDPALAETLAREAGPTLRWLESHGMRFQDTVIEIYGAHWPRVHKPMLPLGEGYIRTLSGAALRRGVRIETGIAVSRILIENGRAAGVEGTRVKDGRKARFFARRSVIIASGGFSANRAMVEAYAPMLAGLTTDNAPGATGEMLLAAEAAGAELIGMDLIQCIPGCPPGRKHRVRLHSDVSRFILTDARGRRFMREDERRDRLRDAVLALPERYAYSITDDEGFRSYSTVFQKEAVIGVETGDAWRGDTLEELARAIGMPPENLAETVKRYNAGVREGRDAFGKSPAELRHEIRTPPFWACYAGMTVHSTMGGIRISPKGEALDAAGKPISGLFAAGEAAPGVHGINRMGANGVASAIVFGRIAGASAALWRQAQH